MTRPSSNPEQKLGAFAPVLQIPGQTEELTHDPAPEPKLRVWAMYPDGSYPESIEVTYAGDEPVTVELIAGIVRSLERPAGPPSIEMAFSDTTVSPEAFQRAVKNMAQSQRGNIQ